MDGLTAPQDRNTTSRCDGPESGSEERVLAHFRRQAFLRLIGAEPVRVLPGFCSLQLRQREELMRDRRCFHPGAIGALAVGAGECAALSILPSSSAVATIEHKLNLLAPAVGDMLVARAKVIASSTTMTVCTAEIYVHTDRSQNLCAVALMTLVPG